MKVFNKNPQKSKTSERKLPNYNEKMHSYLHKRKGERVLLGRMVLKESSFEFEGIALFPFQGSRTETFAVSISMSSSLFLLTLTDCCCADYVIVCVSP